MKKAIVVLVCALALFMLESCASTEVSNYGLTTAPEGREYVELGKVVIEGSSINCEDVMREARKSYPKCNGVINIVYDTNVSNFGPFSTSSQKVYATAVEWKDDVYSPNAKSVKTDTGSKTKITLPGYGMLFGLLMLIFS